MSENERNAFEWEEYPVNDDTTLELCKGLRKADATPTAGTTAVFATTTTVPSSAHSYKHSCVIDAQGVYKTLVLVTSQSGSFTDAEIYAYQIKAGETLIDTKAPSGSFCKPKWDGEQWIEGANDDEVSDWEAAKPVPEPAPPSQVELLAAEMTTALAAMQMENATAMSEMQLQHDMAIAELTVAMAGGTEVNTDV